MRSVWAVVSILALSCAFGVACGASSGSEQSDPGTGGAAGSAGSANGGAAGSGVGGTAGQGGTAATGGNATGGNATGGRATGGNATGGDLMAGGGQGGNAGTSGGGGMSSGGSAGESSGGSAGMPIACNEPNVFCPPGTQCACDPANNPNVPATCVCHKRCSSANDCEGTDSLCGCGGGVAEGICVSNCFCLCG